MKSVLFLQTSLDGEKWREENVGHRHGGGVCVCVCVCGGGGEGHAREVDKPSVAFLYVMADS